MVLPLITKRGAGGAAAGGLPGAWVKLGEGPTSVANNTTVSVLAGQTVNAGEAVLFVVNMKDTPSGNPVTHFSANANGVPALNELLYSYARNTSGTIDFQIRHREGATRDIDWAAYKVTL